MPTLLIVDPFDDTRKTLARNFVERGWDVRQAANVADGLAGLGPPTDCLIVELNLPDGDGTEVLRAALEGPGPSPVTIVLTAHRAPDRLAAAAVLGPHLMVQKPLDWEVLWRYCQAEFDRRAADAPS
jgi:DNA-binding response OmpR family regulator